MSDILVVQLGNGVGDWVNYRPHLHTLAQRSKTKKVSIVTGGTAQFHTTSNAFLKEDTCIDQIFVTSRKDLWGLCAFYARLKAYRFKEVWIFHRSTGHAIGAKLAGIPNRYGFGFKGQGRFLTHCIENHKKSLFHRNYQGWDARQLMESHGMPIPKKAGKVPLTQKDRQLVKQKFSAFKRPWIGLGIGASDSRKRWTPSKFAQLIQRLRPEFPGTFFLWGHASETPTAEAVLNALSPEGSDIQIITDLTIQQSIALMDHIDLFIGNDSALLNIAAAAKKPAVGIYGLTLPLVHSPHFISVSPPHYVYNDTAIETVQPDHVLATLAESVRIQEIKNV